MDETTITTAFGVLGVVVGRSGRSWVARLQVSSDFDEVTIPPSVGTDRDSAVRNLTWTVRSLALKRGLPASGLRPGSWDCCP